MDASVQFVRNALCTVKNFNILGDTFLYDPKVTAQYYSFPSPLDQTTPLEVLISTTQFYAFVSITLAGYGMVTKSGVRKLQLISRLVNLRTAAKNGGDEKKEETSEATARKLVDTSVLDEGDHATRTFFVGANVLVLGIAFFWLFANSFHVTATDWIGGPTGLMHALTVMEIALVVFLYYMLKDAGNAVRRASRMKKFAKEIKSSKKLGSVPFETITVEQYSWLVDGWSPFWAEGTSTSTVAESKQLTKEEEAVASKLVSFSKSIDGDVVERIEAQSRIALFEGYREYVYLILNFFAFYGYLACIVAYYYNDESAQPQYVRALLLWLPNTDADWLGNATGDFMWTVEPLMILGSPMIVSSMSPKKKKKKEKAA